MANPKRQKSGRGGPRTGTPGTPYANRSDLATKPRTQPVRTATGQSYGTAQAQQQAQQIVPLPAGNSPATPAASAPSLMVAPPTPLAAPTQRPAEHVLAGAPTGPGPGPEVFQPPDPLTKAAAVLNSLPNPDAATLRLRTLVNSTLHNQGAA